MMTRGGGVPVSGFPFWAGKRGTCVWRSGVPAPERGPRAAVHHFWTAVAVAPGREPVDPGPELWQGTKDRLCRERGMRTWGSAYAWYPVVKIRGLGVAPPPGPAQPPW
jgi:hypothetical protein